MGNYFSVSPKGIPLNFNGKWVQGGQSTFEQENLIKSAMWGF